MEELYKLYCIIEQRKSESIDNSYTNYLFNEGIDKIAKKVNEEAMELVLAAKNADYKNTIEESVDLIYHMFVLLANQNIQLNDFKAEVKKRQENIGNLKIKNEKVSY